MFASADISFGYKVVWKAGFIFRRPQSLVFMRQRKRGKGRNTALTQM